MNATDLQTLKTAVDDAAGRLRRDPNVTLVLAPVRESLASLCETLRHSAGSGPTEDAQAAALVVARDVIASALSELRPESAPAYSAPTVLALASLHNRLVAALSLCAQPSA